MDFFLFCFYFKLNVLPVFPIELFGPFKMNPTPLTQLNSSLILNCELRNCLNGKRK